MNINRNNYEVFFIDYHDGNLAAEQVAELFLFLESNTDLKDEFDAFSNVQLEKADDEFPFRDGLKRGEVNEQNVSWYLAASAEGDLSATEQTMLDEYIKRHKHLEHDVTLFNAAKLTVDYSEVYPNKKSLKQPVPFVFNFDHTFKYAVAAMLFLSLMAGGYFIYTWSMEQNGSGIAEKPIETQVQQNNSIDTVNAHEELNRAVTQLPREFNSSSNVQVAEAGKQKIGSVDNEKKKSYIIAPADVNKYAVEEIVPVAEIAVDKIEKNGPVTKQQLIANNPQSNQQEYATNPVATDEEYLSVWEAVRLGTDNGLRKLAGYDDNDVTTSGNNRVRVIDVIGKGVEKVSNEKIKVQTQYNKRGQLSAFNFAAGRFKIERTNSE